MSTEHTHAQADGNLPVHKDVNFESKDINVRTILMYLLALAVAVAAAFAVTVLILRVTEKMAADSDRSLPPSHQGVGATKPPEPMLQGVPGHTNDPQEDLREKMAADTKANEQLGWVDRSAGIAQIPVEDAMKMIVNKGLPSGAAPTAEKSK
ncbi:MAG TPA: hypothetical protein VLW46_00785 [Candidatus Bathyarchaeia archaeon]|nr:hypothetical protein [Candidatus Bathyarchaeia archaeon]